MTEIKVDLISHEWLKDAFDNLCCHDCKICRNFRNEDSFYKCNLIEKAPTVEQTHGEWEKYGDKKEAYDIEGNKSWGQMRRCTNCGFIKTYIEDFGFYAICPNCGAKMDAKEVRI